MGRDLRRKMKILLVCIVNKNCGDTIIAECTSYLLKKVLGSRAKDFEILRYSCFEEDTEQVKYADAVIFAGGGVVKYKNELFYKHIYDITAEAEKYGVPVFLNAVGVEGFDGSDERCKMLAEALNRSCVKGITVRDDCELLKKSYITNNDIRVRSVLDPAVWARETYKDRLTSERSGVIGLGVARGDIFTDYGSEKIDRAYMLEFWKKTAAILEKRGFKWKIFTNGFDSDERFAKEVLGYIGHGEKVPQPCDDVEFVNTVNSFGGIVAVRMHANITAYSLGVPSVGLVWNDKLRMWGEKIGMPERFITADRLTPKNTFIALDTALKHGSGKAGVLAKRVCPAELKMFVSKYCRPREAACEETDLSGKTIAVGLGGADFKFKNLNSVEVMKQAYKDGFRVFETDVRLTADGRAVCVNGWSENTFKKLGLPYGETSAEGLGYEEFMSQKYYGKYPVSDFEQVVKQTVKYDDIRLIIDVGKPKKEIAAKLLGSVASLLKKSEIEAERVVIRLQRPRDLDAWEKQGYPCAVAYFLPYVENAEERAEKHGRILELCKERGIRLISMLDNTYDEETAALLKRERLKPIVFTYTKTGDIIAALKRGAYLVGSFYYSPNYLKALTEKH